MQDRFLFRGKRIDSREWDEGFYVFTNTIAVYEEIYEHTHISDCEEVEIDPNTLCQCTGLKDKNDKLIFEGDIIKTSTGWVGVVEWDSENARFMAYNRDKGQLSYVNKIPRAEIIGNIFDNPNWRDE